MKGACFYADVADEIGAEALDVVLADFYAAHAEQSATMPDMIAAIQAAHPDHSAAVDVLVADWLTELDCPADYAERCAATSRR